jgi:hypothetical protein
MVGYFFKIIIIMATQDWRYWIGMSAVVSSNSDKVDLLNKNNNGKIYGR